MCDGLQRAGVAAEGHRVLYDREVPFEIRNQTDPHDSAQEVGVSAARRLWAAGLRMHVRSVRASRRAACCKCSTHATEAEHR